MARCLRFASRLIAASRAFRHPMSTSSWSSDLWRQQTESSASHLRWASAFALGSGLVFFQLTESENAVATENKAEPRVQKRSMNLLRDIITSPNKSTGTWTGETVDSYRRRVFFNYEKRLRLRSSPEKVFEYFASVKGVDGEYLMTPADLMRAIVPVFPPSDSTVVRGGSLEGEPSPGGLYCSPSKFFLLFDTNEDGYISFSEYIFLVTLLSIPVPDVAAAIRMFDLDNDGKIDRSEFKKVMKLMQGWNRQGAAQRGGLRPGFKTRQSADDGGLIEYLFGKDDNGYMYLDEFENFVKELHEEIIRLEFMHYDHRSQGSISARDFALSMIAAAEIGRLNSYLDRVDELGKDPIFNDIHISFEEFRSFVQLRKKLHPLSLAISSSGEAYGSLSKTNFQQAADRVCGVPITENVAEVIFFIFDTNRDGSLCTEEFLGVLDRREGDICWPRESGLVHYANCLWNCAKNCRSTWLCG